MLPDHVLLLDCLIMLSCLIAWSRFHTWLPDHVSHVSSMISFVLDFHLLINLSGDNICSGRCILFGILSYPANLLWYSQVSIWTMIRTINLEMCAKFVMSNLLANRTWRGMCWKSMAIQTQKSAFSVLRHSQERTAWSSISRMFMISCHELITKILDFTILTINR